MVYEYETKWKHLPLSAFEKAHGISEWDDNKKTKKQELSEIKIYHNTVNKLMEKYKI